jgi:hypothetical protein
MGQENKSVAEKWRRLKQVLEPDKADSYEFAVELNSQDVLDIKNFLDDEKERIKKDIDMFFEFMEMYPVLCQALLESNSKF